MLFFNRYSHSHRGVLARRDVLGVGIETAPTSQLLHLRRREALFRNQPRSAPRLYHSHYRCATCLFPHVFATEADNILENLDKCFSILLLYF